MDLFPAPTEEGVVEYLEWDDWKIAGILKEGKAGEHGEIILNRNHYRVAYETGEVPKIEELIEFEEINSNFENEIGFFDSAEKSWYKKDNDDIPIIDGSTGDWKPLSKYSSIVKNMTPCNKKRIYVKHANKDKLKKKIEMFM